MKTEIEVWQEDGMWAAQQGDITAHGDTREDAIFWLGWWVGRKELGDDVESLVRRGGSVRVMHVMDTVTRSETEGENDDW